MAGGNALELPCTSERWVRDSRPRELPAEDADRASSGAFLLAAGHVTISLLPEFMAASFRGLLSEVEQAARAAEQAPSVAAAAQQLRPELNDERSAARWLRRRLSALKSGLSSLVTSVPELFGVAPTLSAVAARLAAAAGVLVAARSKAGSLLERMGTPLGFRHRSLVSTHNALAMQHTMGPAPG